MLKKYIFISCCVIICLSAAAHSGVLRLRNDRYEITFDGTNGDIICLRDLKHQSSPVISGNGGKGLWIIKFRDGKQLASRDFTGKKGLGMQYVFTSDHALRLNYCSPLAVINISVSPSGKYFDFNMKVSNGTADVLSVSLPASIDFSPAILKRVIFPNESGIALQPGFYARKERPVRWVDHVLGPGPLQAIAGLSCSVLPVDGTSVPLTVSPLGRLWMGDSLADVWGKRIHIISRPIVQASSETFISSGKGAFLAGYRAGKGRLLCFGGKISLSEKDLVLATIGRILSARLQYQHADADTAGKQVLLLDMEHGPLTTGWSEIPARDWVEKLPVWINGASCRNYSFNTVNSVEGLLDKLGAKQTAVVINPYGESFPVENHNPDKMISGIRNFIEKGGLWVTTGGYPFFYEMQPSCFMNMLVTYPYAFADFIHLDALGSSLSLYSIQKEGSGIFMPAVLDTYGDEDGGHAGRTWSAFIAKGATCALPMVRICVGETAESDLGVYARENGFTRTLKEKMPDSILQKWKSSVIYKYAGGTLKDQLQMLNKIPNPGILHLWDFLKGGFDKEYPDILPPNPEKGTADELRNLMSHAHDLGHLVMPYTNPTWWGDAPKGPTFQKEGNNALLITLDSQYSREQYGTNTGWNISPWHPDVIASEDRQIADFLHSYPADILFEDQVGARNWIIYDINHASPAPYAYQQGLIHLAERAARSFPLATEHGYDRLINAESEFCGLTWQLVPFRKIPDWLDWWLVPYSRQMKNEDWQFFPMAMYITHGKTFFTHHLGGPMVQDAKTLSWTLLLGYQLIEELSPFSLRDPATIDWLTYISHIQKVIGSQYMGEPLKYFHYLKGSGNDAVIESWFGKLHIIANLTDSSYADENRLIAPHGFYAASATAEAGILLSKGNHNNYYWIIKEKKANGEVIVTDYTGKIDSSRF